MKNIFAIKGLMDYLLQVSLIILSILIATGLNRCNENNKDEEKLNTYLIAIEQDLEQEISSSSANLRDAESDLKDLEAAIRQARHPDIDSLQSSMRHGLTVFVRSVYRTFKPSTFELMSETGDILLIDDLDYRSSLAGQAAFRNDYVKKDLENHDRQVLEMAEFMGTYIDLPCAMKSDANISCLKDAEGYSLNSGNKWMLLHRAVTLRAFHLQASILEAEKLLARTREKLTGEKQEVLRRES